ALRPLLEARQIRITFPAIGTRFDDFRARCAGIPESSLHFYPRCGRDDFLALMASHDVYLSSARSDSSPASLIEAMALGLVPVAADIDGIREWMAADNGFAFPEGDAAELRSIVRRLLDGAVDCTAMVERNVRAVRDRAVFEDNIARTIEIMRGLCNRRG
ncbi:MAG: glycosyltransferase, partial [candidate division Zixibacteria bacterium]|nr:glycosyltransferase [candidate division Zixibacteria bacterium]